MCPDERGGGNFYTATGKRVIELGNRTLATSYGRGMYAPLAKVKGG